MEESFLLRAALIIAVIGLCALFIIMKINFKGESDDLPLSAKQEGEAITLKGTASSIRETTSTTIITLDYCSKADIMLFGKTNLSKGAKIEVTGKAQDYKGKKEIIADRIVMK